MASDPRSFSRYRRVKRAMLAEKGDVCWLCGHRGATAGDHVTPHSLAPGRRVTIDDLEPVHGVEGCPTCRIVCNSVRGTLSPEAARAKIAALQGRAQEQGYTCPLLGW